MSVNEKTGLGYNSQLSENEMPKCEIFEDVSDSSVSEIDKDNNQAKDRTSVNENESVASKSSEEIREEPKTVRSSAPIIKDWEYDSEDECEDTSTEQDKSSNDNSGNPQYTLQDQGIFNSGCSRHATSNKSFLTEYQEIDGGFVAFGGSPKGGKIIGKGKIRTRKLDFEDVYFVKELKFNLFSFSKMCEKKNSVLFTEIECLVLSSYLKLLDESQVLLKVPR
uniref:Retrovirus-related Pol polyprotein from transposon TNT 1-94-like beta-barrel domain-containing protein n=1 Tax=Tanacetum cinerariifolium TaxID=118510 RepID=A0A699KXZ6_TANCI|nr:hypothetical protein [Tanacetum cinerariifolium]